MLHFLIQGHLHKLANNLIKLDHLLLRNLLQHEHERLEVQRLPRAGQIDFDLWLFQAQLQVEDDVQAFLLREYGAADCLTVEAE